VHDESVNNFVKRLIFVEVYYTPPPIGDGVIVFDRFLSFFIYLFIYLFVCFFVSKVTRKRLDWTDLHDSFREGVHGVIIDDLIKFSVNSGKWVGGSRVNLLSPDIAIWFNCCLLAVLCCHLATENVMGFVVLRTKLFYKAPTP